MQRAANGKLEPVSEKLELPFSRDCLGKVAGQLVHKSVVVVGQKLVVADRKPVVLERKPAGRKLAVERNLAADHKSIVERMTAAVQQRLAGTTLQAIKKRNKKKIHSFSAHEMNVIQTNNANLSFLLHANILSFMKHETSRSKVPFFVHFSFSKIFFC